jgi:CRP/FNR family transcriptional regulator, cyclic AMP receptor protein
MSAHGNAIIRLLEHDAELGQLLSGPRLQEATRQLTVHTHRLDLGPWDAERLRGAGPEHVGLLVLEGLIAREVVLADNVACELMGPGDLVRPWQANDPAQLLQAQIRWTVLESGRLAVLDRRFAALLSRYPEVNAMLIDRLTERAQRLAIAQAISQLNGVDRRLLALFWYLAERWGRVVPQGVAVTLPVPHRLIAQLVGARRPTVSTALSQLAERGDLVRLEGQSWLLTGEPVGVPTGEAARIIRGRRRRFRPTPDVPAEQPPAAAPASGAAPRVGKLHNELERLRDASQEQRATLEALRGETEALVARMRVDRERRETQRPLKA